MSIKRRPSITPPQSIMIVDEDQALRLLMANLLRAPRRRVIEARSAEEAIEQLDCEGGCQLLIGETELPGTDGLGLLRQVKTIHPEMPFVFLTGNFDIELYLTAMDEGAFDYLPKPVQLGDLMRVVDRALSSAAPLQPAMA